MKVHDIYLSAISAYLPDEVYSADQAVRDGVYSAEARDADGFTGVRVAPGVPAPEMGLRAARAAVERFGVDPGGISMIIYTGTSLQGPDGWGPATYLMRHLGVPEHALPFEIRHQCNGLFSSLHVAACHLRAAPEHAAVLIVLSDNWSAAPPDRWSFAQGMPLGDGASALVLTRTPGFARLKSVDTVVIAELEELHRGGDLRPPIEGVMESFGSLRECKARFIRTSPHAPNMHTLVDAANERLNERTEANAGLPLAKVDWAGTINASDAVVRGRLLPILGIPPERSTYDISRDMGHFGCSDQVVGLERLLRLGRIAPGDHYLMAGFGPGLTCATAVVEILSPPPADAR